MRRLYTFCTNTWLAILYISLCLVVYNEVHPFTRMPMYDYPSDKAFAFKLTDQNGNLIPTKQLTLSNPGRLSHIYSTVCSERSFDFETTDKSELRTIGEYMYRAMNLKPDAPPVQIHRVQIHWLNDSLIQNTMIIFNSLNVQ